MLGMKKYPRDYIDACRARIDADLRAYRQQVAKSRDEEFESRFFNNQVLLLDRMFVHRLAGLEGKDGNPVNEVRVLCNSLLLNKGKLQVERLPNWPESAGSSIKLPPETSILRLRPGDEVKVREADFVRLSKAFFTEIEKKFG